MKTMKSLIVALALFIGAVSVDRAIGEGASGWNVTVVTGTSKTIFEDGGKLRRIVVSSGTTTSLGDYLIALKEIPSTSNGAGVTLMPTNLFQSTTSVGPTIVFKTTTTVSGSVDNLNNGWSVGEGPHDYIRLDTLHIRKNVEATGEAGKAWVYWSN